jgi:hypothetical protein
VGQVRAEQLTSPDAWRGSDLTDPERWTLHVTPDDVAELRAALRVVAERDLAITDIRVDDFPLDRFRSTIDQMVDELQHGLGFILLSGLPVHDVFTEDEAAAIFWGIGQHMGVAVRRTTEVIFSVMSSTSAMRGNPSIPTAGRTKVPARSASTPTTATASG